MANTYVDYTGNGSTTDFNFSFPYIKTSHVAVEVNDGQGAGGTNQWVRKTLTTDYSVQTSPNTFVRFVTAPASNVKVRVLRDSDANEGIVDFANGSVLTETELDNSYQHNRYLAEEAEEGNTGGALTKRGTEHYNADGLKLENVADPDSDDDAVNKGYADTRYVDAAGDTMSGNLNMGANKVTSSATPSSGNDLTNKTYTDATFVDVAGDTMSGDLNMGGNDVVSTNSVQGLVTPTADTHAANKKYVDDNDALQVTKSGDTMSGDLNMGSNKITNVTDPSANQEAATKKYVDDTITTSFATGSPPPGNTIGTNAIDDGAVTTAKVQDDSITYAKLQNVAANNVLIGNDNGAGVDAQELTATEARTLLNVADGATANDSDANLKDRANHTGTQTAATISDFDTEVANNSAVAANTAKISYTDAAAVALNTAKVSNATHTGDATGDTALTLATVNSNVGSFTNADITVNAKGLITAAASGSGGVSKYTAAWNNSHGAVTVANGSTHTITHNLGTTDVQVAVYVNTSASDSGVTEVNGRDNWSTSDFGASVTNLTSNSITLQLGSSGYSTTNSAGVYSAASYASAYIKVVVIG
jgi:hypothetical protein